MNKKIGLGRGLSSLIPQKINKEEAARENTTGFAGEDVKERVVEVDINKISANPYQPRQVFEHGSLEELINSIKEHGILQPLIVTKKSDGYELVAGERRLRSAQILKMQKVPVIVRQASKLQKLELALIENVQRRDLNPMERAEAYSRLANEFNLTQEEIARKVSKPRSHVANTLRYLNLSLEIKKALAENKITEGHAKVILGLEGEAEQLKYYKKVIQQSLTVRDLESEIKKVKVRGHIRKVADPDLAALVEKLEAALGTRVKIQKQGKGGRIVIEYYSAEELDALIKKFSSFS